MGLRSPQSLLKPSQKSQTPVSNFRPMDAPRIDTRFLSTLERGVERAAQVKAKIDKDKANFARAKFENDLDTMRTQAEAKLSNLKGEGALAEAPDVRQEFLEDVTNRLKEVPEQYRRSADIQIAALQSTGKFNRFTIGYTASEGRKVADETYKTRIANDMNDIVDNALDLNYVSNIGLGQMQKSIRENAERTYGSDYSKKLASGVTAGEMIQTEVDAGTSRAITNMVQQQVNVNAFDKAQETLVAFSDKLNPSDRIKVSKIINKGLKDREDTSALAIAEEAYLMSDGDMVQAEHIILANTGDNGSLFRKSMNFINAKNEVRKKQKTKEDEQRFEALYDSFVQTGVMNNEEFKKLPAEDRNRLVSTLNKNKGGEAVITDIKALEDINDRLTAMSVEELAKVKSSSFKSVLSAADREMIDRRVNYARKQIDSQYAQGQKWDDSVSTKLAADFAPQLGLIPNTDAYSKFKFMIIDRQSQIMTENPKITPRELKMQLIRDIRDNTINAASYEYDTSRFNLFGREKTIPPIEDIESFRPTRSVGIHSSWVRKIQSSRLQDKKRPYTEDELNAFAEYLQNSNKRIDLTKPVP